MNSVPGRPPSDDEIADWLDYGGKAKPASASGRGRLTTLPERKLWESYVASGQIGPEVSKSPQPKKPTSPHRLERQSAASFKIEPFEIGSKAPQRAVAANLPSEREAAQQPHYQLDGKIRRKLKGGKIAPESSLDLHGLNRSEAGRAVEKFVLSSFRNRRRLVLIVTGKGREKSDPGPIPQRSGILRLSLQAWLDAPPLNEIVQYVGIAHEAHGGGGAFYVYLRRQRRGR